MAEPEKIDTTMYDGPDTEPETVTETVPEAEASPEVAPETTAEPEAPKIPPLTEEQQQVFNDAIAKKVAKQREAERKAEEIERKFQEAQAKLAKYETPIRPDIPPPPDRYDYNSDSEFQQAINHRDALIARATAFDVQANWERQQEQYRQQQAQAEQVRKTQEIVETYSSKAEKLGIAAADLQVAGQQVAEYGIPERIAARILRDERGPEVTLYLSRNLAELDTLSNMEPEDAAVYIETVIKPKSRRNPPKLPTEPAEPIKGAGVPEGKRGPPGVKYE